MFEREWSELRRIIYEVRCAAASPEGAKTYSDVTSKLDRIEADITAAGRRGKIPKAKVEEARRRIRIIQKEVLVKGSQPTSVHGSEAGTLKETVHTGALPHKK